jgi:hypothetical protein
VVHCRPAFDTNLPKIICDPQRQIIQLNGLYRHGYLFAPVFAEAINQFFSTNSWNQLVRDFLVVT